MEKMCGKGCVGWDAYVEDEDGHEKTFGVIDKTPTAHFPPRTGPASVYHPSYMTDEVRAPNPLFFCSDLTGRAPIMYSVGHQLAVAAPQLSLTSHISDIDISTN